MANMIGRLLQLAETDAKLKEKQDQGNKKAYSNMMTCLKEMKLHNEKNLDFAEKIYDLSESSLERLNHLHEVMSREEDQVENLLAEVVKLLDEQEERIRNEVQGSKIEMEMQLEKMQKSRRIGRVFSVLGWLILIGVLGANVVLMYFNIL